MKKLLVLLAGALPHSQLKVRFLGLLGWQIGRDARVGPGLYLNLANVSLGAHSRIGPFNVIRDLSELRLGDYAVLGQWNWVSAATPLVRDPTQGQLRVGDHSAVTSRHYLDCSGSIDIGAFSTVAGVRSTFITHGINWSASEQRVRPIKIGSYCLISSNCCFTPGSEVPDATVIGMGATVGYDPTPTPGLWVQPRASWTRDVEGNYFTRQIGFVNPGDSK